MRALYLQDGFPSHRVRASEHEEELILPDFADIRSGSQQHPVTETCQWIDAVYDANAHHNPTSHLGSLTIARLCIRPTPEFGITEIRRITDGRTNTYRLLGAVETVGSRDRSILDIEHHPVMSRLTYEGKELFHGEASDEHLARDLVQPIVQEILEDLGYGDPAGFSAEAIDLKQYRSDHNIVWPRPLTMTA